METAEDAMDRSSNNSSNSHGQFTPSAVIKGKRTKRQRPGATAASSISSAEISSSATEEDEDMANCLILLAQGRALGSGAETETAKLSHRRSSTEKAAGRLDVYQCKTCNKCFPSFQALGGHRTSHKKPKIALLLEEEKKPVAAEEDGVQISTSSSISRPANLTPNTNNNSSTGISAGSNNKPRVHECSICGSEFSSGQALGGHMRRHRPIAVGEPPEAKKEKNVLSLDLNLPAPADDDREELPPKSSPSSPAKAAFPFDGQQMLVFSASALVDCHY